MSGREVIKEDKVDSAEVDSVIRWDSMNQYRSAHGTYRAQAKAARKKSGAIESIDSELTVRSGHVYEMGQTGALSRRAIERAQRLRDKLGDEPVHGIENRLGYRIFKRAFDITFSAAVLVFFSWLFLIVAIAIKLDDPEGPVFFKQERVGKNDRTFRMYKFRSMVADAEARLASLQALNEKDGPVFKIADDPRITRVGKFIRKTSIDELAQFINVFLGQMSVVGPRPALPKEVATYNNYQRQRLLVKPGITCYWQTRRNRDSIGFDEWVDLDLLYIRKCSIWADFKLIVQTVGVVLTMQGS